MPAPGPANKIPLVLLPPPLPPVPPAAVDPFVIETVEPDVVSYLPCAVVFVLSLRIDYRLSHC